jgi:tetratricopeptide (TPR) repeat protein
MRHRIYDFFITDRSARLKMYAWTWLASCGFGVLLSLSGTPIKQSVVGSSLLSLVMLVGWTFVYCSVPRTIRQPPTASFGRRLALASFLSAIAAALGISSRHMEAAVLNRRLLKLTRNPTLSAPEADRVANTLDTARKQGLGLLPATKVRVRDAIRTTALQNPTPASIDAAKALVSYVREVTAAPRVPSEAETAMDSAARHALAAIRFSPRGELTIDRSEVGASLVALTRAIELSGSDTALRGNALMSRAYLYNLLARPDDALVDLHEAEKLGAADLSDIASTESFALLARGNHDDLGRAINLLTLALQLPPPSLLAAKPRSAWEFRLDLYGQRADAYFRVGKYAETITDCKTILDLLRQSSISIPAAVLSSYVLMIRSYLYLGDVRGALNAAEEWEQSTSDPRAGQVRELIQLNPSEAQRILSTFYQPHTP